MKKLKNLLIILFYKSESGVKPDPICLDWSPKNVYLHKDIHEEEREYDNAEKYTIWVYEEAKLSRAEYAIYAAEQNAVDLIEAEQEITDQDLALLEAEQEITDMDLRIMELENAQEGANDEA